MTGIANRQELFSETTRMLTLSKALGNGNFDPEILRKNLFKGKAL
jgi:hypothetical protein